MPAFGGPYSRRTFDENKRYLGAQQMQSFSGAPHPWVDADFNESVHDLIRFMQRAIQKGFGDGSPDSGFKLEQSALDNTNNFRVNGSDLALKNAETAGRMYVGGLPAWLANDVEYNASAEAEAELIHHRSTALAANTLEDSSTRWVNADLVGRRLIPDATQPAKSWSITGNTEGVITVVDDLAIGGMNAAGNAQVGDVYYIDLSTPGAVGRTDSVYLDVYLDEIDVSEDANLDHGPPAGVGEQVTGANRLRAVVEVFVNEGAKGHYIPTLVGGDGTYTDSNGETHWIVKIAELARLAADATVTTAMIADRREKNWGMGSVRNALFGPDHLAQDLLRRLNEVRTWTTVGDGVTTFGDYEGESGLRAAVAAAADGDGIWVKEGTYVLTNAITISKQITIQGAVIGQNSTAPLIKNAAGKIIFDVIGATSGVTIRNLELDGTPGGGAAAVIRNAATGFLTVEGVNFINLSATFAISAWATDLVVRKCNFGGALGKGGIQLLNTVADRQANALIEHCTFSMVGGVSTNEYGVVITPAARFSGLTIRNCIFGTAANLRGAVYADDSKADGVVIEGCLFGASIADRAIFSENDNHDWRIRDCEFLASSVSTHIGVEDIVGGGVNPCQGWVIESNDFLTPLGGGGAWLRLLHVLSATVRANRFRPRTGVADPAVPVIVVQGPGAVATEQPCCTVEGNSLITDGATFGIDASGSHPVIVRGNYLSGYTAGLRLIPPKSIAEGNLIRSCSLNGIFVDGDSCVVRGNVISGCTQEGIELSNNGDRSIVGENKVFENNGGDTNIQIELNAAADCVVKGNHCIADGGGIGKIGGSDTGTVYRTNRAQVELETVVYISPAAMMPGGLWDNNAGNKPSDFTTTTDGNQNLVGLKNGQNATFYGYVDLGPYLEDGSLITELAVRLAAVSITDEIDVWVTSVNEADAFVDSAQLQVINTTQVAAATFTQVVAVTVDKRTKSYYLRAKVIDGAGVGPEIYRFRIKYKTTR